MAGAVVGRHCNLGEHVFVENGAVIGNRVTIKNGVQVWDGVRIADDVFVGPNVTLTNDRYPRSPRSRAAGNRYETKRWRQRTAIGQGAAIGANATIVSGVRIGRYAVVGAGAVVTKSVPPFAVVIGVPARPHGQACLCGRPLPSPASAGVVRCGGCGRAYRVRGGTLHPTRTTGRSGSGP
jgi:acetyltransferase-like isoleucine patch superfamily enzyme